MNRDELIALAERVEALTEPDREVDSLIAVASGQYVYEKRGRDRQEWFYSTSCRYDRRALYYGGTCRPLEAYTADMNAAMSLAGDDFGSLMRGKFPDGSTGFVCVVKGCEATAKTAPNAVTAAALRALAEQEQ